MVEMDASIIFRMVFLTEFLAFGAVRMYYGWRGQAGRKASLKKRYRKAVKYEGKAVFALRIIAFLFLLSLIVLYLFDVKWMAWSLLSLPEWLRWAGACAGLVGIMLTAWAQNSLGKYFTTNLELEKKHALVKSGPYQWVRHPIYTAIIIFTIGVSLVSASALLLVLTAFTSVALYFRTYKEEEMMLERFGVEYREYMRSTGRLLPLHHFR